MLSSAFFSVLPSTIRDKAIQAADSVMCGIHRTRSRSTAKSDEE